MSCAKKKVICLLVTKDFEIFVGTNDCALPQGTCPRLPWEGYAKCKSICKQAHHAEIDALLKAGDKAKGSSVYISHHRVCDDCQAALDAAGVIKISLV